MSLTLYRRCKLGETLIESLDDLRRQNKITDALGDKIMEKFDKIMCEEIPKRQKYKCTMKAKVKNWKNCDDIWIFYTEDINFKTDQQTLNSERLKVVACDTNMKKLYDRNDNRHDDN